MNKKTWFLVFLYIGFFGTIFIFAKQLIPPLNSVTYISIRCLLACIPFALYFLNNRSKGYFQDYKQYLKVAYKDLFILTIFTHMLPLLLIYYATPYTSTGNQSILNSFATPMAVLINFIFYKQKTDLKLVIGVIISTIGVILIIYPLDFSSNETLKGDLLILVAMIGSSWGIIINAKVCKDTNPTFIAFTITFFPGIILFPFIFFGNQITALSSLTIFQWLIFIWLGFGVGGLGYMVVMHIYADPEVTPAHFGVLMGLVFTTGLILGIIIYNEKFLPINLFGAIFVVLSVVYVNIKRKKPNIVKN